VRRDLLIAAQKMFYARYPNGFDTPELAEVRKKHRLPQMQELVQICFSKEKFEDTEQIASDIFKVTQRSSLVSVFEKMRFRDLIKTLNNVEKEQIAKAMYHMLFGEYAKGFAMYLHVLSRDKIGKWPILTIIPYYFSPNKEIFVKPTTVKNIIRVFELEGIVYQSQPSYAFYKAYRDVFLELKAQASPDLAPDNGAFSGFLMMAMRMMDENNEG